MQNYKEYHYYLRVAATLLMAILMIVMGTSQIRKQIKSMA